VLRVNGQGSRGYGNMVEDLGFRVLVPHILGTSRGDGTLTRVKAYLIRFSVHPTARIGMPLFFVAPPDEIETVTCETGLVSMSSRLGHL
jgi:hypothetical protein